MARWQRFRDWQNGIRHVQAMTRDISDVVEAACMLEQHGMIEPVGRLAILDQLDKMAAEMADKLVAIRSYRNVNDGQAADEG